MRPASLLEFVGNEQAKKILDMSIRVAKKKGSSLPHILFTGASGCGKTTLTYILANEMNSKCHVINAANIDGTDSILDVVKGANEGDIVFIDEIHSLTPSQQESLYHAMEDGFLEVEQWERKGYCSDTYNRVIKWGSMNTAIGLASKEGEKRRKVKKQISIPSITFIGASTAPGKLAKPFRDRFPINVTLKKYTIEECAVIASQKAKMLGHTITEEGSLDVGKRAMGVARVVTNYISRCCDMAFLHDSDTITKEIVEETMRLLGIDENGYSETHHRYLKALSNGKMGLNALVGVLEEDKETIEMIENSLIQDELVIRSPRGRELTENGREFLGIEQASPKGGKEKWNMWDDI